MKIAITGGTGFVGGHLAKSLTEHGHNVVLIARGLDDRNPEVRGLERTQFMPIGTSNQSELTRAFEGCDAVAHCAGINREVAPGDYDRVHVRGTQNVVDAATKAGVKKVILISFYRARPNCGSLYHESKFAAEEIVRNSGLDYTIFKAGMMYGKGDHMLDHLSHIFHTLPLFGLVGFKDKHSAPLAIEDFIPILEASLVENRMSRQTIATIGPERMTLAEAVKRVAKVVGKEPLMIPMPIAFHYAFAHVLEATMKVPLVAQAQVRILTEGFDEPYGQCDPLPSDLTPKIMFTPEQIRRGLPEPGPFTFHDLKCGGCSA